MKKISGSILVVSLVLASFLNIGLVGVASADTLASYEDETFYGKISGINSQRRRVLIVDEKTSEEFTFRVLKSTLSKVDIGERVRVDYSPFNDSFDIYKIVNKSKGLGFLRVE